MAPSFGMDQQNIDFDTIEEATNSFLSMNQPGDGGNIKSLLPQRLSHV